MELKFSLTGDNESEMLFLQATSQRKPEEIAVMGIHLLNLIAQQLAPTSGSGTLDIRRPDGSGKRMNAAQLDLFKVG